MMPPTQKVKSSSSRLQMKKLKQILKNQAAKMTDVDPRSRTVDQAGGITNNQGDSDDDGTAPGGNGARRKKKARRKEKPLKLDYREMRDDDEDDFNCRAGGESEPENERSESEDGQDDDNLSEDGRKLKE
jgi:hypothetical protein